MIKRTAQKIIEESLYKGKVITIYGARRVGKTTLSKAILESQRAAGKRVNYLNCESSNVKNRLETTNELQLKDFLGDYELVVLDEAQNIERVGHILKLLVDTYPDIQIIATGSSSFELSNQVGEPLVGRGREFKLLPFSTGELAADMGMIDLSGRLESLLRFGSYPTVFGVSETDAKEELNDIAGKYLYKDILAFENLRNSDLLLDLLKLIALQVGNEVSLHEIGTILGLAGTTVKRYIDLLEKCFIIFRLPALSRNLRKEIAKSRKIYFYDLGIRNALIQNFNTLDIRNDVGALWENFCIVERMKRNEIRRFRPNTYFWRLYSGPEVDYIEEHGGRLDGFEFKYGTTGKFRPPRRFIETYENSTVNLVNPDNWYEFTLK
ncbi:Archaeal ATPase [Limihaloglobus sulfuriphilus]|uniref:Archaeal ATPase n=1 Tax=Limihaloglobus sulfuriphilus TaxID=1851148 RepID=A0A1Q2MIR9_9BACT|nr:ATP-binding protein [Limihaloglobus sulfuriphilus]AQQ72197.1 Archaeal ATPase [Limihaloglobus sulfuriphilus]